MAKLQTGGGCSLMYEVAHSMICMRAYRVCWEMVKGEVTKFVEMSVSGCVCWVDTVMTDKNNMN